METTQFRYMYNLLRHKGLALFVLFFFLCASANAQFVARNNYNYLDFQSKPYYFGFSFGLNSSNYRIDKSREFISNPEIAVVESIGGPGLSLSFIGNLKIGEYFDFRTLPGFTFAERTFEFSKIGTEEPTDIRRFESVYFEIPFHLRFKSVPYKDKRAFLVAGVKYAFDVQANNRARRELTQFLIETSPHDFQFELGVGLQFFKPFFIFSPELKISRGINNVNIFKADLNESRVLESVKTSIITLSFHFEG